MHTKVMAQTRKSETDVCTYTKQPLWQLSQAHHKRAQQKRCTLLLNLLHLY